jgi:hypothetical protein
MKISDLKKMHDRKPFRPFSVHLTSGEVLPVGHPEQISISPEVDDLFSLWVSREWNLIDVSSISRLSVETRSRSKS